MQGEDTNPSTSTSSKPKPKPKAQKPIIIKRAWARLLKQILAASFFTILVTFVTFTAFRRPDTNFIDIDIDDTTTTTEISAVIQLAGNTTDAVKVYLHDLPRRFTSGVIAGRSAARGGRLVTDDEDVSSLQYPGHQHMAEWYLFKDLNRAEWERIGSPVTRVMDPEEADLFYVAFFSSLSLTTNSDAENQEALVEWLEGQEHWRRNKGRDHVIIASDPNALGRVLDRVKNSVLLVSDFGRLKEDQGSLVKDVIVPYSHRIRTYEGNVGMENRNTLLFFMGNRFRKEGGKIRDTLFQILENEEDVIIKHGTQSVESRRAASHGMHTSKFCLHPAGDTPSACRLFDAIVSLCVPIVVSDYIELPFEDVIDYRKVAIFVETELAVNPGFLVSMLRAITPDRILVYQTKMKEVKRYFEYGVPNGTVNEIWRQVVKKLPTIKLMSNRDKRLVRKEPECSCICAN